MPHRLRETRHRWFQTWEAVCIGLLTLTACAFMGGLSVWVDLASAERAFNHEVNTIQRDLARRFGSSDAVLTSLVGLHHASENLKTYELAALSRELLAAYPYIRNISKILVMSAADRAQFEQEMRSDGFLEFSVTERDADGELAPAAPRRLTMPIRLFEPLEPEFARLVGFDVASDPTLAPAVAKAIETGRVIASEPVEFSGIGRGFFAFKAYYLGHEVPRTAEERKTQVSGVIGLYLEPKVLFRDFIDRYNGYGLRLYQDVVTDVRERDLIFNHPFPKSSGLARFMEPFSSAISFHQLGSTFVLEIKRWPVDGTIRFWFAAILILVAALAGGLFALAVKNHRVGLWHALEGERRSRENEKRFRDYAEIASDWFWSTGPDGRFQYISDRMKMATGLDPREFLGHTPERIPGLRPSPEAAERYRTTVRQRKPFRDIRYEYLDNEGRTSWWSVSGKPVTGENGAFLGYLGTGRNITAAMEASVSLQKAKEQAELANRAKSEFLANMSHELRTPLNAIMGFSQVLIDDNNDAGGDIDRQQFLKLIHESGQHLLDLINDILDLAKIESGNAEIDAEWFDVSEMVPSVTTLVRGRAEKGEITLATDIPAGLPRLYADKRKIKQVLINLMSNGIKFTEPGGRVTLAVSMDARKGCVFEISDTGIGMDQDGVETALTPFAQLESDLDRKYEGTGLGLPLTKRLIELHEGRLEIRSQLGVGTTVEVVLPPARVERGADAKGTGGPDSPADTVAA